MTPDYEVMAALYAALKDCLGQELPVFQHVPVGVAPPYVVLEMDSFGPGNGLPSPHFQARGSLKIKVWSDYEGRWEISKSLQTLQAFLKGKWLPLNSGRVWFDVANIEYGPPPSKKNQGWQEGYLTLLFVLKI